MTLENSLPVIWYFLIFVLLSVYMALDGFDLGAGIVHLFLKKEERSVVIKAIAPYWDGNEVWLLTGGGAVFAAFPKAYATTFSGFYLAMIVVILALIARACGIEFRDKVENDCWKKTWDITFGIGSLLVPLLLGVALGNIIHGLPLDEKGNYTGTFFELLNPYSLVMGLGVLAVIATHGALYLANKTSSLRVVALNFAGKSWWVAIVLCVVIAVWALTVYLRVGVAWPLILFALAIWRLVMMKIQMSKNEKRAFISSVSALVLMFLAVLSCTFPYLVAPVLGESGGLTLFECASSTYTLTAMLIITLITLPIVLWYTIYIYKVFAGKVD
ncbi:MAG: cytochrome d ubiquinol oxidase subunit II [Pseudomonadota bacterium]